MMKKILFLADAFYPNNSIGSVRISELTQRLSKEYDCYVVVDNKSNGLVLNNVHYIYLEEFVSPIKKTCGNTLKRSFWKKFVPFKRTIYYLKKIDFAHKKLKKFKSVFKKFGSIKFDYIISTFDPLSNMLEFIYLNKVKHKETFFISDFRDPMSISLHPFWFRIYNKKIQNRVCKISDLIIAVSKGYLDSIVPQKMFYKATVITNGYANPINESFLPKKFDFFYAGSMYGGKRKFDVLFNAINILLKKKMILEKDIEIKYAGLDSFYFEKEINKFNLQSIYSNLGQLTRSGCHKIESESFYLLVSTWNNKDYQGVIPGKFYEYMSFKRKIICVCTGNLLGAEISNIIKQCNLGYSIENDTSVEKLSELIYEDYLEFKKGNYICDSRNIEAYSYDMIAAQYIKKLEELRK